MMSSVCSTIIRPGPAISLRRSWCGRPRSASISPNPTEVASVHRIALDDIERAGGLRLHHDPRKHATRHPLSSRRPIHPRADGGADLSVPRSARRPRYPCGRTGAAGLCLEVNASFGRCVASNLSVRATDTRRIRTTDGVAALIAEVGLRTSAFDDDAANKNDEIPGGFSKCAAGTRRFAFWLSRSALCGSLDARGRKPIRTGPSRW